MQHDLSPRTAMFIAMVMATVVTGNPWFLAGAIVWAALWATRP
jgi:hypothetical protein